jgi:hypothetical protein
MTDFRALCAELLYALESERYAHWVNGPVEADLCLRARAALAEPELPKAPVPVAWMYRGEPDFDGKKWRENWLVTLDQRVAEHGVRLGKPIPLFHAQTAPPADGEVAKLVAWLLDEATQAADANQSIAAGMLTWAAQIVGEYAELEGGNG